MLKLKRYVAVLAGLFLAGQAQAQISQCNALLDHGITNLRNQVNEQAYLSVIKDQYCSTSYDSMSSSKQGSFNAVVKTIPVGLSGSGSNAREKHSQFCKDFQSTVVSSDNSYLNVVTIHNRALESWNRCQELATRNLEVAMTPLANQTGVDLQLLWRGTGTSRLDGVATVGMVCNWRGRRLRPSESIPLRSEAESIRCERTPVQIALSGYNANYFPDANVNVKTREGAYSMEFADMVRGPAQQRFEQLEAEVARAHHELAKYKDVVRSAPAERVSTITGSFSSGGWGGESTCPAGTYVTGVAIQDQDQGSKCPPCISNVRLTCSKIPAAAPSS